MGKSLLGNWAKEGIEGKEFPDAAEELVVQKWRFPLDEPELGAKWKVGTPELDMSTGGHVPWLGVAGASGSKSCRLSSRVLSRRLQ